MDINYVVDAKTEYTKQLQTLLVPRIYEGIESIYDDAYYNDTVNVLHTFQKLLREIPKWNKDIIEGESNRILEVTQCDWLDKLITAVFVSNTKILTAIKIQDYDGKIDISIPKVPHFIHRCYVEVARELYKNPYLFDKKNGTVREKQQNLRTSLEIIETCIESAIRSLLPIQSLLKEYLGNLDVNNKKSSSNIEDNEEQEESDNEERGESDNEKQEESDNEKQEESDNEEREESDDEEQEESDNEDQEESDNEEQEESDNEEDLKRAKYKVNYLTENESDNDEQEENESEEDDNEQQNNNESENIESNIKNVQIEDHLIPKNLRKSSELATIKKKNINETIPSEIQTEQQTPVQTIENKQITIETNNSSDINNELEEDSESINEETKSILSEKTINEIKEPTEIVSEIQESKEVVSEIQKPTEVVSEIQKPTEVVSEIQQPTEVVKKIQEPIEVVSEIQQPTEIVKQIQEPTKELIDESEKREIQNQIEGNNIEQPEQFIRNGLQKIKKKRPKLILRKKMQNEERSKQNRYDFW